MKPTKLFLLAISLIATISQAFGQETLIKGTVTSTEDGSPIFHASVQVLQSDKLAFTDESGYFVLNKIPPGTYVIKITAIGFSEYSITLEVQNGPEIILARLNPSPILIREVQISAERQRFREMNTIGTYQINSQTIKKAPTIGGQSDFAQFLQLIPGINFTGDRGGQYYVRGGAPIYNKVTIDGITLISPFHSIGFMSVFDTDIINQVNVYTAGFNAQEYGRLSSVMNIKTRDGNRCKMEGKASATTLGVDMLVQGPIMKAKNGDTRTISYLFNYKKSYIDRLAPKFYPYLDSLGLPYKYGDFYGKISMIGPNDYISLSGHHFTDQVNFSNILKTSWESNGINAKMSWNPVGADFPMDLSLGYSDYYGSIKESSQSPRDTRYKNFLFHLGSGILINKAELKWACEATGVNTGYRFVTLDKQNVDMTSVNTDIVFYGVLKRTLKNWIIEPGMNFHWFSSQNYVSYEPRLQVKYNLSPVYSLNFATGLYAQDLLSSVSEQDITCLFQGFYSNPEYIQTSYKGQEINNSIERAWHGVAGISSYYLNNLKITAEIFVKDFYRLVNSNRNKLYEDTSSNEDVIEYLKKNFIFETGWSYGLDLLVDYQNDRYSIWLGYSLAFANREDEYSSFVPHFDRRHNVNMLFNYQLDKKISLKARWNLASGYPFTQNAGLYEELIRNDGTLLQSLTGKGDLSVFYGNYNEGRLPWYHRLDLSAYWLTSISEKVSLEINAGIMNVYNRKNVFYLDRLTGRRVNQLPILPNAGMVIRF